MGRAFCQGPRGQTVARKAGQGRKGSPCTKPACQHLAELCLALQEAWPVLGLGQAGLGPNPGPTSVSWACSSLKPSFLFCNGPHPRAVPRLTGP